MLLLFPHQLIQMSLPHLPDHLSACIVRFEETLFIYSADVGTGAAGSPWLLHSHVTHEASLEILRLL